MDANQSTIAMFWMGFSGSNAPNRRGERWSWNLGPVGKVDRMMREVIPDEETKEPFT
jgi:hypothetical protein